MFADELVGRKALEGLQSAPEVVGADEVGEVLAQLVVVVVVEAFDGRVLDCPVHAFDLAIRPGVLDLGEPVFDLMLAADALEDVFEGICMPFVVGELDAIIREHNVDPVRHGCDQIEHRLTKIKHPWTNDQVERMNRTIKEATVKRFHYDDHSQIETHLTTFINAYNFGRRLKTLKGLTPYEFICKQWTIEPERFTLNPIHQMPGLNT